jgi:hypothetical protein
MKTKKEKTLALEPPSLCPCINTSMRKTTVAVLIAFIAIQAEARFYSICLSWICYSVGKEIVKSLNFKEKMQPKGHSSSLTKLP